MTEEQKGWGGARPGAGRPRKSPPQFEPDQWRLIAEALREYASMNSGDEENPFSEMADSIEAWQKGLAARQIELECIRAEYHQAIQRLEPYIRKTKTRTPKP